MLSSRHARFIDMMFTLASRNAPVRAARLASCLVISNEIISIGINQLKSHPFQSKFSKNIDSIYLHAETDAIKNALKNYSLEGIKKSTLYVARAKYDGCEKNNFIFGLAKPCIGCQRAIASFGISNVVYTTDENSYSYL